MSAIVKTKHTKTRPVSSTALWLVLGLAVAFFLVRYGQELLLEHSLMDQASAQRQQNAALADDNNRLKALLQYYQSDRYIEQRAREDLNLRLKDETVLIPMTADPGAATAAGGLPQGSHHDSPAPSPTPAPEPNWQKWLDIFAPGP